MLRSLLVTGLLAGLTLVACGAADDTRSDDDAQSQGSTEEAFSLKRSKRDYCCIKKALDVVGTERVAHCHRIRDYRDEVGRASARTNCEGFHVDLTSPSIGFGAAPGSPVNHDLVAATCDDRPECQGVGID